MKPARTTPRPGSWDGERDAEELAADPVDRDTLDWLREASSIWDKVAA
jgi:hypothetical protein